MERSKFKPKTAIVAARVLEDQELVEAFAQVSEEEKQEPQHRRPHLKRIPVWLEEYRWKKGQSGNPTGRPQSVKVSPAAVHRLKEIEPTTGLTYAELIAFAMIQKAIHGDVSAAREIREMTEGAIPQKLEISGNLDLNIEDATNEELDRIIRTYFERQPDDISNNNSRRDN